MEDRGILIDTNILIEYLRAKDKTLTTLHKFFSYQLYMSAVTIFELFAGATDNEKLEDIKTLVTNITKLDFKEGEAILAAQFFIDLRQKGVNLKNPNDLFIAAVAISNNLPILTLNTKDFQNIQNLKLITL